jgi:DNA polymerase-3 subunit alpha
MAAVLSNNMNDIKQVSFFMEECKRMGLAVLGPDVNESFYKFTVNQSYAVRFGMGAIKGVGSGAVQTIVEHRKDGKYRSIFDLAKRIDLRAANKKAFENLALAGGFDSFVGTTRAQYFHDEGDGISFLEKAIRYGNKFQENENSSQVSLFGEASDVQIPEPVVPPCEDWNTMEKLAKEKEVVGIYISGHPLDDFKYEIKYFCNAKLEALKNLEAHVNKNLSFGGIITQVQHRVTKNGKGWATFVLEGYDESFEFRIFNEEYLKFKHFLIQNNFTYLKLLVKEGWPDKETGKKTEPRIQFTSLQYLQDVLPSFAKKLVLHLNIADLSTQLVTDLSQLFQTHKGEQTVSFEVMELEHLKRLIEPEVAAIAVPEEGAEELVDTELTTDDEEEVLVPTEVEETKIITRLSMPSRKLKVAINADLLSELERLGLKFKLN